MVVGARGGDSRRNRVKPLMTLIPFHIKFGAKKKKKRRPIPKCKMKEATGSETKKLPTGHWVNGCRRVAWPGAPPVVEWA